MFCGILSVSSKSDAIPMERFMENETCEGIGIILKMFTAVIKNVFVLYFIRNGKNVY